MNNPSEISPEAGPSLRGDRCQCTACHENFNSTRAFDKHRTGDYRARRCQPADMMEAKGMSRNAKGFWITSKRPVIQVPAYVGTQSGRGIPPTGNRKTQAIARTPALYRFEQKPVLREPGVPL